MNRIRNFPELESGQIVVEDPTPEWLLHHIRDHAVESVFIGIKVGPARRFMKLDQTAFERFLNESCGMDMPIPDWEVIITPMSQVMHIFQS